MALWVLPASPLYAHASEQAFVLLLPLGFYAAGGTLAVMLSIVLVTLVQPHQLAKLFQSSGKGSVPDLTWLVVVSSALATITVWVLLWIGFYGPNDPQSNLLPLTIWTVWWVGVFVIQGLIFDIWRWLNPWWGAHWLMFGEGQPLLQLPKWLLAWPAVAMFLAFQIYVLADIAPSDPDRLAGVILAYWLFNFAGMAVFGRDEWLRQVECFTVLFSLIGSLRAGQMWQRWRIGFPGWASSELAPLDLSRATFCLMILASGSFDGLQETFWWLGVLGINPLEFPGRSAVVGASALGLLAANASLIAVFAGAVWVGLFALNAAGGGRPVGFQEAFTSLAITILPIALGYHVAHYLVSFLVQIQYVMSTLSDPLAKGWNLFGLGTLRVMTGFLNTPGTVKMIWLTQAGAVVISHILAVLMSHNIAARFCSGRRNLILVQVGLSVLMIAYTVFGLWLLASPRGA
ncbi:MAG: hypothetical protein GKR98_17680 [Boseongicola sp.]|nr:MAG: hypothetical protein GKR98_17680 [Boseongicola sp.]